MEAAEQAGESDRLDRVAGAELGADLEEPEGKAEEREAESRSGDQELARSLDRHLVAGGVDGVGLRRDGERDALAHQQGLNVHAGIVDLLQLFGGELFEAVLDHADGRHGQVAGLLRAVGDVVGKLRGDHRVDDGGGDGRPENDQEQGRQRRPEQNIGAVVAGSRVES